MACTVREAPFTTSGAPREPSVGRVATDDEFQAFHKRYAFTSICYWMNVWGIDWDRVREDGWAGVCLEMNYDFHAMRFPQPTAGSPLDEQVGGWYHGWDCVWDVMALLESRILG